MYKEKLLIPNRNDYPWFLHMYKKEWLIPNPYD